MASRAARPAGGPGGSAIDLEIARIACEFPERLHPVSDSLLRHFLDGNLSVGAFMRFFSLPNSDYIELARCIVTAVTG